MIAVPCLRLLTARARARAGVALLVLASGALAPAPAAAQAPGGGTAYPEPAPPASPQPGPQPVGSASAPAPSGAVLRSRRSQLVGGVLRFAGSVPGQGPGAQVVVQRLDRTAGWVAVAVATVGADGTFDARWRTDRIGRMLVRAVPAAASGDVHAAAAGPLRAVTVFRPAVATYFGPGLFGRRTACGLRLTRALLGVAHRTLPCGTQVDLLHAGRTITVPVVDRGPFRRGTSWDLTWATARALRFTRTGTLGAVRVR